MLLAAAALSTASAAQDPALSASFADPVLIEAGGSNLGHRRLYPSPAAHDINGDGRVDLFIGDLRGHLTYALRNESGNYDQEIKLEDSKGEPLDFANW